MSIISTALRNFKEPTKDELAQIFFSIPATETVSTSGDDDSAQNVEKTDINAVLSLGEAEDSYVSYHRFKSCTHINATLGI